MTSGAQYSIYRTVLGATVALHSHPLFILSAGLLAAGRSARWQAGILLIPFAAGIPQDWRSLSLWCVVYLLGVHTAIPGNSYGSVDRAGDVDPGADWVMPAWVSKASWGVLAIGYFSNGLDRLLHHAWVPDPVLRALFTIPLLLQVAFPLLAALHVFRPWIWLALLSVHIPLIAISDFGGLGCGTLLLHLFAFDPAWIPGARAGSIDRVFYDGGCGLCHRIVRFLIAEDRPGALFTYAPLDTLESRDTLPDSVAVLTAGGRLLVKSDAALSCASRLGGLWRLLAGVLRLLPYQLREAAYDLIARNRHYLFARTQEACPLLPPHLRGRFPVSPLPLPSPPPPQAPPSVG